MADYSGVRRGAVRPNKTGIYPTGGAIQAPTAGGGATTAWGLLARTTARSAEQAHAIYDKQVAVKASQQGALDAIEGRVRNLDRSTTRGGAYMDAAIDTSGTIASTNALLAMSDFFQQYPDDPASLQAAINDYAAGATSEMMAIDPAAAVQLNARMLTHALPMLNQAVVNREQSMAQAKKQAQEQAQGVLQGIIPRAAPGLFSPDREQRKAASGSVLGAMTGLQSLENEDAVDGYLTSRLHGHGAAHIINMQPTLKTRLAAMIEGAPENIKSGLGIYSGFRTVERQRELYERSKNAKGVPSGMVGKPGGSRHNHGDAADLDYNGASLTPENTPKEVLDWVHEHAADYGLTFPMNDPNRHPYEPWHIETVEARGGSFSGSVSVAGGAPSAAAPSSAPSVLPDQQKWNDAVLVPAFRSWFQTQTDKPQAFLDFVNGKTELPMTVGDNDLMVNIRQSLSDEAAVKLQDDLYQQITQENTLRERAEADEKENHVRISNETKLGFMTGILANGQEITVGGTTIKAAPPTIGQVYEAVNAGTLDAPDGLAIVEALSKPVPLKTDPELERGLLRMIAAKQDPTDFILKNLSRIDPDTAKKYLDYWGVTENATGSLNNSQQDYIAAIKTLFTRGLMEMSDDAKNAREADAVLEGRKRMLAGEDPELVYQDIKKRSEFANELTDTMSGLSPNPPFIRPRFSVPDPANPNFIDTIATSEAIENAYEARMISQRDYEAQLQTLDDYEDWQEKRRASIEAQKNKAPN